MNTRLLLLISLLLGLLVSACNAAPELVLPTPLAEPPALVVDEFAVVDASVDAPNHFEFSQRIPPEVRDKYAQWRYHNPDNMVKSTNLRVAAFGLNLQQNPIMSSYSFRLFDGKKMLLDRITWFRPATVNQNGDNFALLVETSGGQRLLVQKGGITPWASEQVVSMPPVYAGDRLVDAVYKDGRAVVESGGKSLFSVRAEGGVDTPLKSLNTWEGHWVMEVSGKVYVDGQELNKLVGASAIFNWQLIGGQPFYFFIKKSGGKTVTGISYAGRELAYRYDEVIHYRCCEPAAFNPAGTEAMTWFYARREGKWYFVQAGVFE